MEQQQLQQDTMRYTSLSFTTWMVIKHLTVTVAFVVDIAQLR